jgi:hypothetical protein
MKNIPEQKYEVGEKVFARSAPGDQLKIRRFVDRVYFCRLVSDPQGPDLVYFERELTGI